MLADIFSELTNPQLPDPRIRFRLFFKGRFYLKSFFSQSSRVFFFRVFIFIFQVFLCFFSQVVINDDPHILPSANVYKS